MIVCQPLNCKVSETEVLVPLQSILNKSAERLCESIALDWKEDDLRNLELTVTLGFDSSSAHVNPQQKSKNSENENYNAHLSLFVSSFIIIQLKSTHSDDSSWLNPTPQSVRFCRPLRIALEKEDDVATLSEHKRLNEEIEKLIPHRFKMSNEKSVRIKFNIYQTLFDGKCLNTIVGNSATSRCPVCFYTAHKFGNLECDFILKEMSLKKGLGLLHCEIKAFEHFLHISYRIVIKS